MLNIIHLLICTYDVWCVMWDVLCMMYDVWCMICDVWCMLMYDVWWMIRFSQHDSDCRCRTRRSRVDWCVVEMEISKKCTSGSVRSVSTHVLWRHYRYDVWCVMCDVCVWYVMCAANVCDVWCVMWFLDMSHTHTHTFACICAHISIIHFVRTHTHTHALIHYTHAHTTHSHTQMHYSSYS